MRQFFAKEAEAPGLIFGLLALLLGLGLCGAFVGYIFGAISHSVFGKAMVGCAVALLLAIMFQAASALILDGIRSYEGRKKGMAPRCAVCGDAGHIWCVLFAPDCLCAVCMKWAIETWYWLGGIYEP